MTSRRNFIKKASLLSGITAIQHLSPAMAGTPAEASLAEEVRRQLLVPAGKLYLNTGSLGPSPGAVMEAVAAAMNTLEKDPVSENWGPLGVQMEGVRKKVADFIHATVEEVILTRNTTEGMGLICQSLALNAGDEIITTTLEHGGGEVGLEFLEKTKGAVIKKVELPLPPEDPQQIVQLIEKAITTRTKLIMLSHVNTVTGVLMPLGSIARLTSARGICLMADGAQAPGLVPIDMQALGTDVYASSGHKWLLGPKETGFLYVRKGFQEKVRPLFTFSGNETYTKSSGTRNVATIIGLGAALDWHTKLGVQRSAAHCLSVRNQCLAELKKIDGLRIISPENPLLATGIVSFELLRAKNSDVYAQLKEKGITVKVLTQHNAIRISCHVFVSTDDIKIFLDALRPLV